MAQLIVYAGAIMVLFIFTIMLLNAGTEHKSPVRLWVKYGGLPLLAIFLAIAGYIAHELAPASEGVTFSGDSKAAVPRPSARACSPFTCCPLKSPAFSS